MREAIDRVDAVARESGARIVHACGYDSIPSDLAVLLLHERAAADGAGGLRDVRLVRDRPRRLQRRHDRLDPRPGGRDAARPGAPPAGRRPLRAEPGPRRGAGHPAAARRRPPRPDAGRPVDRAVRHGRRSTRGSCAAATPCRAGRTGAGSGTREVMGTGRGPLGAAAAAGVTAGLLRVPRRDGVPPTRALLDRVLPAPGTGPSAAARERGWFRMAVDAATEERRALPRRDHGAVATRVTPRPR